MFYFIASLFHSNYQSVAPNTLKNIFKKNQLCAMIVGGFEDATIHKYGTDRIFLKNRKGFVKYGLEYGIKL